MRILLRHHTTWHLPCWTPFSIQGLLLQAHVLKMEKPQRDFDTVKMQKLMLMEGWISNLKFLLRCGVC